MSFRPFSQAIGFIKDLRLKFPRVELEQDYKALKEENVIKDFKVRVSYSFVPNFFQRCVSGFYFC